MAFAWGFNKVKAGSADHIVSGKDDGRTIRTVWRVNGLHLALHRDPVGKGLSGNADTEHLLVLLSFFSAQLHESTAIGNKSIYDLKIQCKIDACDLQIQSFW
jgi:hypothetical protein